MPMLQVKDIKFVIYGDPSLSLAISATANTIIISMLIDSLPVVHSWTASFFLLLSLVWWQQWDNLIP